MPRTFVISNKLIALWGKMSVTDENDVPIYEVRSEFAILVPNWHIMENEQEVGSMMRNVNFMSPTFDVNLGGQSFRIKRKLLAWTLTYYADGGPYDGAMIEGDFFGKKFNVTHNGRRLAKAEGKFLTARDRHTVQMCSDDPKDEVFVLAAMLALQLDGKGEGSNSDACCESEG